MWRATPMIEVAGGVLVSGLTVRGDFEVCQ